MKTGIVCLLIWAVALSSGGPPAGADGTGEEFRGDRHSPIPESSPGRDRGLRLSGGLRSTYVKLLSPRKNNGSFIGSIARLKPEQDLLPFRPFLQCTIPVDDWNLGIGFTYDRLTVATVDEGGGDGDIKSEAYILYGLAEYANPSRFTPFVELGFGYYRNRFSPLPEWYDRGWREFVLKNSFGVHLGGGIDLAVAAGFSLQLYLRYSSLEVDGTYYFRRDNRAPRPFTFTLEHLAYGLGARYAF